MLILTRRLGEKILIGDGISVTVVRVKGNQVRLGIEAPPDVPVSRSELDLHGLVRPGVRAPAARTVDTQPTPGLLLGAAGTPGRRVLRLPVAEPQSETRAAS